ncbi:MAG TPA: excinuclease ABC subunit UvrC [candidate division Zixibacteria bacterium]|nr:excinuclease ABC subunit UvrC [candidate division Zixibacteria bacterium]
MQTSGLETKITNLPDKPGVYIFKDKTQRILYVGKAAVLRNRVSSYFHNSQPVSPRIAAMIKQITDLDYLVTDNEVEAYILEANLIKEYKPCYNVNLKDDKRYPYVKLTSEPFSRLLVVRRMKKDGARYFGPFTNVGAMRQTLKTLTRIFQIRSCNLVIPPPNGRKYRVCLEYHIKRCPGPCEGLVSSEKYKEQIDSAGLFLAGHRKALIDQLRARMEGFSEAENFEGAALVRDQLSAIEGIKEKQKVVSEDLTDRDLVAIARQGKDVCAVTFQVREGVLIGRQHYYLTADPEESDAAVLSNFIRQYYLRQPAFPAELGLPLEPEDMGLLSRWLAEKAETPVKIILPQKGAKAQLLATAEKNARLLLEELLIQKKEYLNRVPELITFLQKDLRLAKPPRQIAAFDVSNLGETDKVGAAVFFSDGRPLKKYYRHFQIKTVEFQNDFAMMEEIVSRFFAKVKEGDIPRPDLVLIDGGKGQVSSTLTALEKLEIKDQPVIGLAKRLEEIISPNTSDVMTLPRSSTSLKLLQRIRDEVHRFGLSYNLKVRKKRTIRSELDEIPGIGPGRRQILLTHFGSVENMKQATLEELLAVAGIPKTVAEKVFNHFGKKVQKTTAQ